MDLAIACADYQSICVLIEATMRINEEAADRVVDYYRDMVKAASAGAYMSAKNTMRTLIQCVCQACLGLEYRCDDGFGKNDSIIVKRINAVADILNDDTVRRYMHDIRLAGNDKSHPNPASSVSEGDDWKHLVEIHNHVMAAINRRFATSFPAIPTTHEGLLAAASAASGTPDDEPSASPVPPTPTPAPSPAPTPSDPCAPLDPAVAQEVAPEVRGDFVSTPVLHVTTSRGGRNRTLIRALILLFVAASGGLLALWWANSTKDGTSAPQAREAPADGITVAQVGSLDRGDDAGPQSSGTTQTVAAGLLGGNGGSVNGAQPTDAASPTGVASSGQSATSVRFGVLTTAPIDPCLQACLTKNCGSDGCGGSCGTCRPGFECAEGRCVGAEEKSLIGVEAAYRDFAEWHYAFNRRDREATLGGIADKPECYFNAKDKEPSKFRSYMAERFADTRKRVKIPPVELRLCRRCTPSRVAAVEMMKGTVDAQTSPVKKVTILERRGAKWVVVAIADRDAHGCLKTPFEDYASFQAEYPDPWKPPEE